MSIQELTRNITSFAALMLNGSKIREVVADTGAQYVGRAVIEKQPNGNTRRAVIMEIVWESSLGLNGDWIIRIGYSDEQSPVLMAWVGRDCLTLAE